MRPNLNVICCKSEIDKKLFRNEIDVLLFKCE